MKLTTARLKKLIKEELQAALSEGKDEVLKMIEKLEEDYMDMGGLRFTALKKFVSQGNKEDALHEIKGMSYDSETDYDDKIIEKLEKLVQDKM